ncbi:MAG: hypothetical protein A3G33_03965 [Omnitrophica bacterium RIFCSPLOWO2_12_FULL_44_17]|uniref:Uncharacterized protein n=1 Tax=Candidatus Danuiimicrobium aquiferis TaxID=1801832 RepID=A0A1G1KZG5_9BACT|nr:MAG: hypothetical protein A3B72_05245 [Omnitrophica bacterium RIFCSPHIGHO2_02_FULL_45_28]OGW89124.1 MAG: hypothetical protein A3E74_08810 [Omnitrophica bacterium RIFCSPHIGHO2_12_FULL_44_12]OGW98287.1 MAG: hypothetical protein A3G33_03965 [Omnitrophica bacterium RIFCSPLOWO2_12_FULL_44_17]OGX02881.1 MAG: hypothetical protein A3J12_04525 [Omnitrophica bacterium RIFCSPLOWO2_02_FULL_44_11]
MEHLNITFPEDLKEALDREAKRERTKRSTLIQKAVVVYLKLKRRKTTEDLLKEGYQEMIAESENVLRDFKNLDNESWDHAG